MNTLICPISSQRISKAVVRVTGFMMALMIALYGLTGLSFFLITIAIDYFIRAFTPLQYSSFSWVAHQLTKSLRVPDEQIDKAPKLFAARVGFLFAFTAAVLFYVAPTAGFVVAFTLMGFALLESVLDICVGCLVYTYVVFPIFGK
ncbi:MAG: DUF4395 domain-containing protein [Anaerolineae bacterium]|nr:DUF4395 domain-containing protein [Anaerolineae bacterium]